MDRKYDKGDRRYKHVGRGTEPSFEVQVGNPKRTVGKCPFNIDASIREALLNEAIAAPATDRELSAPKRLYAVHGGAIYEAQTSDRGLTYHGYPYRGRLSARLLAVLRQVAHEKGCVSEFDEWTKRYIMVAGG
jgi:hypothetical protein